MSNHFNFDSTMIVSEADNIKSIAAPLKLLGIDGFFYMRIYPDNKILDLTTDLEWGKLFFDNLYQNKYKPEDLYQHMCFTENVSLWANNPHNVIWQEGEKYFNIGNGVSIFRNKQEYTAVYSFYSKNSNYQMNNFYVNNLDVLDRFINYFEDRAATIINRQSRNVIVLPEYYATAVSDTLDGEKNIEIFMSNISSEGGLNKYDIFQKLSSRQKECLKWICMGKTAEEIGIILGCSHRTIEAHIKNIKDHLGCSRITEVIYFLIKNKLIDKYI